MKEATSYSLDENLATADHGAVTFDRAKEVFELYYSRLRPDYDSGETALAETMFGFSRSEDEFIELCLHQHDSISCKVCLPAASGRGLRRFFARPLSREETLASRDAALERLRQFFMLSTEELRQTLESD